MWKRILTLFIARTLEFFRDKTTLLWNLLFPFFIIVGLSFVFNQENQTLYKVGVVSIDNNSSFEQFNYLKEEKQVDFIFIKSSEEGMEKLSHHRIELLVNLNTKEYWINSSSPKGDIVEKLLFAKNFERNTEFTKQTVKAEKISYVEWLFPGILGMNMMFNSLFGVGYVVVRYRKNGVLKRISVTPTRPFEFLAAQVLSRMFVISITTSIVYLGCSLLYNFENRGSYFDLFAVLILGGFSMISLGLLVAARSSSEEFADGILNIITWPMIIFSEVWFSLEGTNPVVQKISKIFPLTHIVESARKIMNDGKGLADISEHLLILIITSAVFLTLGSLLFKWHKT
ncbi:MAG: ABC transporter permease [Spirochaetes bacterium]|nr:ABC transporter permease [Spirochaetota bacterium]